MRRERLLRVKKIIAPLGGQTPPRQTKISLLIQQNLEATLDKSLASGSGGIEFHRVTKNHY